MNEKLKNQLSTDLAIIIVGIIAMCFFFYPFHTGVNPFQELKDSLRIVNYVAGFSVAVALITHLTRRLLFPYIKLRTYAEKALEESNGAAIVFFGICLILAVTIDTAGKFFH
jgi:hydrogenase/urease accessory protein HupE